MWKDFVAINGSECVRALTCIAIDDPHWEVVEESIICTHADSKTPIRQRQ